MDLDFSNLSNEKNTGCLGYIGDYTTQLYRDYNKPSYRSLLNNHSMTFGLLQLHQDNEPYIGTLDYIFVSWDPAERNIWLVGLVGLGTLCGVYGHGRTCRDDGYPCWLHYSVWASLGSCLSGLDDGRKWEEEVFFVT